MLHLAYSDIVVQEVPGEVSLSLSFAGCPFRCPGCHSEELRDIKNGTIFTVTDLECLIKKYSKMISCVLFLGGEWNEKALLELLILCKKKGLKTALYTGKDNYGFTQTEILNQLDFLKFGPYIEEFGPLTSSTTNQRFLEKRNNLWVDKTYLFQEKEKMWKNFLTDK